MVRWLGRLWALPVAVPVWLLYLLPAWALGLLRPMRTHPGVVEWWAIPRWEWWRRLWSGWSGHALPYAIVLTWEPLPPGVVRHELRHTDQWLVLGPLFPIVYLVLLLACGYHHHPLEQDARAREDLPCA